MAETTIEKNQLKPVILEVLNDLFNISDIEEAKRTPVGRLINLEAKIESLAYEVRNLSSGLRAEMGALHTKTDNLESSLRAEMGALHAKTDNLESSLRAEMDTLHAKTDNLESSLRTEMKSMKETNDARFEQLISRLAFLEKLLYLILAGMVGALIKIIFFP